MPEISIDPEEMLLSLVNDSPEPKCFYISLGHPLIDADDQQLPMGCARCSWAA